MERLQWGDRVQAARWDAFVTAHGEGSFFHLSGWQRLLEELYGHTSYYLYAEQAGQIVGVLPLARVTSRLFGDQLVSTPFCVYGGALASSAEVLQALLKTARQMAELLDVDHLELRSSQPLDARWVPKPLYATFRKPIVADPEANLMAIPRKQRAEVRRGIKAGLSVTLESDVSGGYAIYAESLRNLGTPVFPVGHFQTLKRIFGDGVEMAVVRDGGQPVSSVLSFYYKDQVLPYYGGARPTGRRVGAYPYMYYDLMNRAASRGARVFDFGRSKVGTGAYDFKRFYGFSPEPLHYGYHLVQSRQLPDLNPLNPKYQRFIRLWRQLPLPIANLLGPRLARSLG
uniref:BioF2-like acetyltransferase domain-containing protein n=1 Tax=Magnetococcus massalia (strain MO-1) TaxID=451514 RepID=A0A1S7LPI0_MAGMO|nr:Conserved protein of unknown function, putative acyl-CoA N-acyltransferase [Candidatus Magnetococcus massalia]